MLWKCVFLTSHFGVWLLFGKLCNVEKIWGQLGGKRFIWGNSARRPAHLLPCTLASVHISLEAFAAQGFYSDAPLAYGLELWRVCSAFICWLFLWSTRWDLIQIKSNVLNSVTWIPRLDPDSQQHMQMFLELIELEDFLEMSKWCKLSLAELTCLFQLIGNHLHCSDH